MKKAPIILTIIVLLAGLAFYLLTAFYAKKKSEEILEKFKDAKKEIAASFDSSRTKSEIDAVQNIYPISEMNTKIILLIDSLNNQLENMSSTSKIIISEKSESDLKRLLAYIQGVNKLKWNLVDSKIPDTIKYWSVGEKFTEEKWISLFFKDQPKEVVITYLKYLKNQTAANNY